MKTALMCLMFCCAAFVCVQAQEQAPAPAQAVVPSLMTPEKRALIKEILELTNSGQSSEAMFNAQFAEMDKKIPDIQWQAIASMEELKRLTPAQQNEIHQRVQDSSARLTKRIKELFLQRVDIRQLVEDVSYEAYDRHFTEAELKDLVAFYRSATGKKVVAEMPALFAEELAKANEIISPKVQQIFEETQKEQTEELNKEIEKLIKAMPPKAAPKKPTSRKRH
jgi:uncharacterized protein